MIHFSETQKFRQWWLWLIIIFITGQILYGLYLNAVLNESSGEGLAVSILGFVILAIVIAALLLFRLDTLIQEDGIYYRFFPIHRKFRKIEWQQVRFAFVRKYNPVLEYGGWGLRILGMFGKGTAVNISGNMGLQLVFTNDKRFLIGTRKPKEMEEILRKIGKWNTENV